MNYVLHSTKLATVMKRDNYSNVTNITKYIWKERFC